MEFAKLYSVFLCTMLCARSGESVELQPASESIEVCLDSTVQVNCTTFTADLFWKSADCSFSYDRTTGTEVVGMVCDFVVTLLSTSPNLVSTATLSNIKSSHNGTVLTCVNTIVPQPMPQQLASINIFVQGSLSTPLSPGFSPHSPISVVLSWIPPKDSACVTFYTITLTNITEGNVSYIYNTTTNTTSKTVSNLTQGAEYTFTVAGVDAGDRVGEKSVSAKKLNFDVPEEIADLHISNIYETIIITWMPPSPSSKPPLTGYKISHNTTGSLLVNETTDTNFTVEGVAPGLYLFTVLAINVLGDGKESDIIVSVNGTTKHLSTINADMTGSISRCFLCTSIAMDGQVTTNAISTSTTSGNHEITMTPYPSTTIHSPSQSMESTSIGTLLGAVIGVIMAVILIIIVLAIILACRFYCFSRKRTRFFQAENLYDSQESSSTQYSLATTNERLVVRPHSAVPSMSSQYSVITTEFGGDRVMPPAPSEDPPTYSKLAGNHKIPQIVSNLDSGYSEVRMMDTKKPLAPHSLDTVPPETTQDSEVSEPLTTESSSTVQYAVLSKRSRNAPPVLPPEVDVVYTQLRANQECSSVKEHAAAPGYTIHGDSSEASSKGPPPLPPRN